MLWSIRMDKMWNKYNSQKDGMVKSLHYHDIIQHKIIEAFGKYIGLDLDSLNETEIFYINVQLLSDFTVSHFGGLGGPFIVWSSQHKNRNGILNSKKYQEQLAENPFKLAVHHALSLDHISCSIDLNTHLSDSDILKLVKREIEYHKNLYNDKTEENVDNNAEIPENE